LKYEIVFDTVRHVVAEMRPHRVTVESLTEDTVLFPVGDVEGETLDLDSTDLLAMVSSVEDLLAVQLPPDVDWQSVHNLGEVCRAFMTYGHRAPD